TPRSSPTRERRDCSQDSTCPAACCGPTSTTTAISTAGTCRRRTVSESARSRRPPAPGRSWTPFGSSGSAPASRVLPYQDLGGDPYGRAVPGIQDALQRPDGNGVTRRSLSRNMEGQLMRVLRVMCCALAFAVCLTPAARADQWDKRTYLTFSGPVEIPGKPLPAGTYMFKPADSPSNRHIVQIFDKDGTKIYATLLAIPNEKLEPSDKPVVMFAERPAGTPVAVKAWFYPG